VTHIKHSQTKHERRNVFC